MQFNQTKTDEAATTNHEDGEAYLPESPQLGLYKLVVNNLLEDTYYEEDVEQLRKLAARFERAAEAEPEYPLRLAAYARQELYLRQVPQVLLVLSANHEATKGHVRAYAPAVIRRADELCTSVAVQLELFGKPLPSPLKKGVADAFHEFDRYQLSKYRNERREVSLVDVMNLVHPRPETPEEEEVFERLALGDLDDHPEVEPLEPPETWEVVISERGNTADAWREVLPRMGIFAKIRNLRNMLDVGLDGEEMLDEEDLAAARESKVYPFRFYQAYRAVVEAGIVDDHVEAWLSDAVDATAENVPEALADTFVAVDLSGSMSARLSDRSTMTYREISAFFGAVLARQGADVGAFASTFERVHLHQETPTLSAVEKLRAARVGGATNGWKVLDALAEAGDAYDRVVLLTDMQLWDSTRGGERTLTGAFDRYRGEVAPDARLYEVDLSSYGHLATPEGYDAVYRVSGWNDRIVDFVVHAEAGEEAVETVQSWTPPQLQGG
jgi:60 kDa SS-A/Ro ribonucleoprotein